MPLKVQVRVFFFEGTPQKRWLYRETKKNTSIFGGGPTSDSPNKKHAQVWPGSSPLLGETARFPVCGSRFIRSSWEAPQGVSCCVWCGRGLGARRTSSGASVSRHGPLDGGGGGLGGFLEVAWEPMWLWVAKANKIPFRGGCTTHCSRKKISGGWDVHWKLTGILTHGHVWPLGSGSQESANRSLVLPVEPGGWIGQGHFQVWVLEEPIATKLVMWLLTPCASAIYPSYLGGAQN